MPPCSNSQVACLKTASIESISVPKVFMSNVDADVRSGFRSHRWILGVDTCVKSGSQWWIMVSEWISGVDRGVRSGSLVYIRVSGLFPISREGTGV